MNLRRQTASRYFGMFFVPVVLLFDPRYSLTWMYMYRVTAVLCKTGRTTAATFVVAENPRVAKA